MATDTTFKTSNNLELWIPDHTDTDNNHNLGTAVGTASGNAWKGFQATEISVDDVSAPLEVSATRSGLYAEGTSQGYSRADTQMYQIDATLRGSAFSVLASTNAVFEDGVTDAALAGTFSPTSMVHGSAATVLAPDLLIKNASSDSSNTHMLYKSCLGTSVTLAQDHGTEGGELSVTTSFVSAYKPEQVATAYLASTAAFDLGTPKRLTSTTCVINEDSSNRELFLLGYDLTISREIVRIACTPASAAAGVATFLPYGYAMTGAYEVSGTINVKRDDNIDFLYDDFIGSADYVSLTITGASNFTISLPKVKFDNPKPEVGDSFMTQSMPFRAFFLDTALANNVVSISVS
tara:strand:+ start:705 stop:1751 length:1047 start_codon:yes stop_codon:yes gene_type:complete